MDSVGTWHPKLMLSVYSYNDLSKRIFVHLWLKKLNNDKQL